MHWPSRPTECREEVSPQHRRRPRKQGPLLSQVVPQLGSPVRGPALWKQGGAREVLEGIFTRKLPVACPLLFLLICGGYRNRISCDSLASQRHRTGEGLGKSSKEEEWASKNHAG